MEQIKSIYCPTIWKPPYFGEQKTDGLHRLPGSFLKYFAEHRLAAAGRKLRFYRWRSQGKHKTTRLSVGIIGKYHEISIYDTLW